MIKPKILYATQDMMPYVDETEIGLITRYLAPKIQRLGYEIRLFMPCFGTINTRREQVHEVQRLGGANFVIGSDVYTLNIKAASIATAKMQIYFTNNDDLFKRRFKTRDANGTLFADNHKRMVFYARTTLATIERQLWQPVIVHCHGWFSMLVPLYLRKVLRKEEYFSKVKIVVSVYDDAFEEVFADNFAQQISIKGLRARDMEILQPPNYVNLMKLAIANADGVIIASPNIHPELQAYIAKRKLPTLQYQPPDNQAQAYASFYGSLLA
jgi:starch synthase